MRKKKAVLLGATTAVAAFSLLMGTFAWSAISQVVLNEKTETLNPGARLHDDFDGKNKDVYVENYTNPDDGGMTVYARVRLYEYLEIGEKAGEPDKTSGKTATSVVTGAKIGDTSTWTVHNPYGTDEPFHDYINWEEGGSTTYMPTYNKNKDDLTADINGTLAGTGSGKPYDDYVDYTLPENATKTSTEVYSDTTITDVEHQIATTLGAQVMTMSEWKAAGCEKGEFWVYDTDGWAYWADGIEPGTATGCLLNGISRSSMLSDEYYYGINVVGQFVTAGEWKTEGGKAYFTDGQEATNDALKLLAVASGEKKKMKITVKNDVKDVELGDVLRFQASVLLGESVIDGEKIVWELLDNKSENTTINSTGILTVGEDESSSTLVIKAVSESDPTIYALYTLHVNVPDTYGVEVSTDDTISKRAKIVVQGRTKQFLAEVTKNGVVDSSVNVVWKVENNISTSTKISNSGVLQVDASETAEVLLVTATCEMDGSAIGTYEIDVITEVEYIPYVVGTEETVYIDNYNWYVLLQSVDQYLLWCADCISEDPTADAPTAYTMGFNGSSVTYYTWETSNVRIYLNDTFKKKATTLSSIVVDYEVSTREYVGTSGDSVWNQTTDQFFLLSEADVYGTTAGVKTKVDAQDYTYGTSVLVTKNMRTALRADKANWLRSTYSNGAATLKKSTYRAYIDSASISSGSASGSSGVKALRPACWVKITK